MVVTNDGDVLFTCNSITCFSTIIFIRHALCDLGRGKHELIDQIGSTSRLLNSSNERYWGFLVSMVLFNDSKVPLN